MANLKEIIEWVDGIYQLETTDPVMGGPNGVDNLQAKQLGNRTQFLKQSLDNLANKITNVANSIPIVPVQSVNGKTGNINITAADVNALTREQALNEFLPASKKVGNDEQPIYEVGNILKLLNNVNFDFLPTVKNQNILGVGLLSSNGYAQIPLYIDDKIKYLILQWGECIAYGPRYVTYPISFPNKYIASFATSDDVGGSIASFDTFKVDDLRTQLYLTPFSSSEAPILERPVAIHWLSIGY